MPVKCSLSTVQAVFSRAADRYEERLQQLCSLDSVAGDGDLGVSMSTGFSAASQALGQSEPGNLGAALAQAALAFNRAAPSTLGTLVSAAIQAAGRAASHTAYVEAEQVAEMLKAATEEIGRRGKASRGQKTVLDALGPASEAFADLIDNGATLSEAIAAARVAAESGVEETREMVPQAGRARWMADRSSGHPDAGATAAGWFFEVWEETAASSSN